MPRQIWLLTIAAVATLLPILLEAQTAAYVTDPTSGVVTVINLNTKSVVTTVSTGFVYGVAITPDGTRVYAANYLANTVTVINTATNAIEAVIPGFTQPYFIAISPDGSTAYVTNSSSSANTISVLDLATNVIRATIQLPKNGVGPIGVVVSPNGLGLYVGGNSGIYVIDTVTNAIVTSIPAAGTGDNIFQMAISPDGTRLYVPNVTSGVLQIIDTGTNTSLAGLPIGTDSGGVVVLPNGKVYASTGSSGTVVAIDAVTNAIINTIQVGGVTVGLATDLAGTQVYVANESLNEVSIIDTATDSVIGQIATAPDARWIATVNPPNVTPTSCAFHLSAIQPITGGNAGNVTAEITGCGFVSGVTVALSNDGQPNIVATSTTVDPTGQVITATFALTGVTPGVYNIVVTNPDAVSLTLSNAFTVVQGGAPQIWVDIIGFNKIRIGSAQTYFILVGNSGNVDALGVPIWVEIPDTVDLATEFNLAQTSALGLSDTTTPYQVTVDNSTIAGFYKPLVPAGSTYILPITLAVNSAIAPFQWSTWVFPPFLAAATGTFVATNPTAAEACVSDLASLILTEGFGAGGVFLTSFTTLLDFIRETPNLKDFTFSTYQLFTAIAEEDAEEDGGLIFNNSELAALSGFSDAIDIYNAGEDCAPLANIIFTMMSEQPVTSLDPNDKTGSEGVGTQQYISGATPLRYAVEFGNDPTATAPAQKVVVTDQLDTTHDNLGTFSLGPINFGNQLITPPLFQTTYTATVDLRPTTDVLVAVNGNLNVSTGLLTWTFQSLDPTTNLPPTNPTVGFLPPGANGSVFFTVNPDQGLPTNTQIQNQATITFDVNAPISTPTWFNTLDNTPPTSHVTALPATETIASFTVQWSGADVGSGIASYTIYVSDNGGPFTAFQTNTIATSATFTGQASHTYGFYSIATDAVGNVEPAKTAAEATTTMASAVLLSTAQISTTASGLAYSRVSRSFTGTVTISNISATTLNGPFQIVFTSLPTGVTLANATGVFNGSPYMTVSSTTSLAPSVSATVDVQLQASPTTTVTFTPVIYAGSF